MIDSFSLYLGARRENAFASAWYTARGGRGGEGQFGGDEKDRVKEKGGRPGLGVKGCDVDETGVNVKIDDPTGISWAKHLS